MYGQGTRRKKFPVFYESPAPNDLNDTSNLGKSFQEGITPSVAAMNIFFRQKPYQT